jgi:type II secretory pathway pseudopilin PulG
MQRIARTQTKRGGFTIIEMMVSVGIFVMVLSVSIAGLLAVVDANRKAQTLRIAVDSIDLVMEEMTRNITQGQTYHCGYTSGPIAATSCSTSPGEISFAFNSNLDTVDSIRYWLENGEIKKSIYTGGSWSTGESVTSSDIFTVDHLNFYVWAGESNDDQPRVLISVGGRANAYGEVQNFHVQTTATQRVPK